jgi:hypothetical protein
MAGKSSKATDKKIIDVAHPDTVAANPTARPVIVKRAVLKDPMVVDDDTSSEIEEVKAPSVTKIKIQPLHGDEPLDASAEKSADYKKAPAAPTIADLTARVANRTKVKVEESKTEDKKEDTNDPEAIKIAVTTAPKVSKTLAEKAIKEEKEEPKAEEVSAPESAAVEEPAKEAEKPEPAEEPQPTEEATPEAEAAPEEPAEPEETKIEEPAEVEGDKGTSPMDKELSEEEKKKQAAEQEHQAAINKLVTAGTYTLPINAVERRRFRRIAIGLFVLLLLAGVAWVDLALDAGLIDIPNVKAPTHFFKNN